MDESGVASPLVLLLAGLLIFGTSTAMVLMADNAAPAERLDESVDPGHEKVSRSIFTTLVRPLGSAWIPPDNGGAGLWSEADSAGDLGLSKSPGVLDADKLDALVGLDYTSVKTHLLGLKPSQHFRLLVNELNDFATPLWSFGEARPSLSASTPTAAQFCLDACDHIVLVRLFVFDGQASPQSAPVPTKLPNLIVAAVAADPPAPLESDSVTITATVQNIGQATTAAVPLKVEFLVDGESIGIGQVNGPLAAGGITSVSIAWTATPVGTRTLGAVVDPTSAIREESDLDNTGAGAVAVAASVTLESLGYAFRDGNGDGQFTVGIDTPVPDSEVADCQYDAGSEGLVLPEEMDDIEAESCSLKAGLNLVIAVSLTATGGDIELEGESIEVAPGTTFTASGTIQFGFPNGHLPEDIDIAGVTLDGETAVELTWKEGALDATGATITSCGPITIGGGNKGAKEAGSATLSNATLNNADGCSTYHPSDYPAITLQNVDGAIVATGASTSIKSKGAISVASDGAVDLSNATVDASNGSSAISISGGSVKLVQSILKGSAATTAIRVTSSAGAISASQVVATATGNQAWSATGGGIDFTSAELKAEGKSLTASVPTGKSSTYAVTVTGAKFDDANKKLDVPNPTGTYATGTPAAGYGVE